MREPRPPSRGVMTAALFELEPALDPAIAIASVSAGAALDGGEATTAAAAAAAVRCTESYDAHLYIGTSDGRLLWYSLSNEGSSAQASPTYRLTGTHTLSAASKPVEKLILLPAISVAVVLCESIVSFLELPGLQPIPPATLPHVKAVATVVLDDAELIESADTSGPLGPDGLVSLCIVKRKHIILAKVGRERWVHVKEIPLPGGASIARRFRQHLCIATTSAYSIVNLLDGSILPLGLPISQTTDSPSASVRPSILSVYNPAASQTRPPTSSATRAGPGGGGRRDDDEDGCEFLITSHSENMTLGVFVRPNGEPAPKLIEWPSHPRALVLDGSHVFALLRNDTLEIHDLTSMDNVGTLPLPPTFEPRFLSHALPAPSAWLCGKNAILKGKEIALGRRAQALVDAEAWDELRELADAAWEKQSRESIETVFAGKPTAAERKAQAEAAELERINQEVGFRLLADLEFALARRYLSRGKLDPRVLIRLFKDVRRHVLDDDDDEGGEEAVPGVEGGLIRGPRSWKSIDGLVHANLALNYSPPLDVATDPTLQRLTTALLARATFDLLRGFLVDVRQQRRVEQRSGRQRQGMDELTWRRVGMVVDIVLAKVYASVGDLDELLAIMREPGNESLQAEVERALRGAGQYGMLAGLLLKRGDQGAAMETVTDLLARQDDPAARSQLDLLLDSQSIQLDLPQTLQDLAPDWSLSLHPSPSRASTNANAKANANPAHGLHAFLRRGLRAQLHARHEAAIVRALALAQNLDVAEGVWGALAGRERVVQGGEARAGGDEGVGGQAKANRAGGRGEKARHHSRGEVSPLSVQDAGSVGLNGKAGTGIVEYPDRALKA